MGFGRRTVLDHTQSKLMRNILCKERAGNLPFFLMPQKEGVYEGAFLMLLPVRGGKKERSNKV